MSITGSLVGYENNNEIANYTNTKQKKRRSILLQHQNNSIGSNNSHSSQMGKNCSPSLNSSISNSVITTTSSSSHTQPHHLHNQHHQQHSQQQQAQLQQKYMNSKRKHGHQYNNMLGVSHSDHNSYLHLNSLWSIWYGVLLTLFQGYLAVHGAYRFLGCSLIQWKIEPVVELNLQIILSGVVFILLPCFFTSAVFKVGNLANDGYKLVTGSKERRCSMTPNDGLEEKARASAWTYLWIHGCPTAACVHVVIAMCLLFPRLLLEARIIENGLLPRENIWQNELDFIAVNRRNLVVLSVVTSPYQNISNVDDEDYYNDTMFTAVGGSGSSIGTGNGYNNLNNNNFLLETNTLPEKEKHAGIGKTRFFEVPDLINRESSSSGSIEDDNYEDNNSMGKHNNNNKHNNENNNKDVSEGGGNSIGVVGVVGVVGVSVENTSGGRISVEELDPKEFLATKSLSSSSSSSSPSSLSALNTQITTTTTIATTTPAAAITTSTSTATNNRVLSKNYDKTWDKLGIIGKGNHLLSVQEAELEVEKDEGGEETEETATTTTTISMITTKLVGVKQATSTAADASTTTTTQEAPTTRTTTTTTASTTSSSSSSTSSSSTIKASTSASTTSSTTHNKTHTHSHHAGHKTGRKHNKHGQHRQRNQNHHRRGGQHHHNNSNNNNNNQHIINTSKTITARTDNNRGAEGGGSSTSAEWELRSTKTIDLNRFDDGVFEMSPNSFEHTATSKVFNPSTSLEDTLDYGRARTQQTHPKSTSTTSTTTRDSNIHIVKPEKLPEIIPSTPVASNSKIIEITKAKTKRMKRMADEELQVEIEPEYLIGDLSNNDSSSEFIAATSPTSSQSSSSDNIIADTVTSHAETDADAQGEQQPQQPPSDSLVRLDGFAGMLQIFFGIEKPIDVAVFNNPPSAEFVNLVVALLVWCVRYPAVFWTTTKSFATIFSLQMIVAAIDIVFSYIGVSILYKLHVYSEAMPIQNTGLVLDGVVSLQLYLLTVILIISSSMTMYLYGHLRLAEIVRDRRLITVKTHGHTWIYFSHGASLTYILALAVTKAPLINDLSATYKNNLHCAAFLSALVSVVHVLLWIVIWLGLTAKRRWSFKLPPVETYGITKATTQPLLMANRGSLPNSSIGGAGAAGGGGGGSSVGGIGAGTGCGGVGSLDHQKGIISNNSSMDGGGGVDDIYWPKLTPSSPKLKVTFNEVTSTSDDVLLIGDHEQTDGKRNSPRGTTVCFTSVTGEIDDGEYATLRAATAATVLGINSGIVGGSGVGAGGMSIGSGCGVGVGAGTSTNTPTGSISIIGSVKILHLSEYDELPPPPPQLMASSSSAAAAATTAALISHNVGGNSIMISATTSSANIANYANCGVMATPIDDNISEEGKLLACVRDDSVTYASTRNLEPPHPQIQMQMQNQTLPPPPPLPPNTMTDNNTNVAAIINNHNNNNNNSTPIMPICGRAPQAMPEIMQLSSSPEHLVSPLAPVTVTVHTNEAHIASSSTPRCLRRADSGVPNEALTPRSDTTSTTESTTSPPERAPSESSSGVHSGEERDVEVVIRPRAAACKPPAKPPPPVIQEEPYGRCTNMRMSSFVADPTMTASATAAAAAAMQRSTNSATLPLQRTAPEQKFDYTTHCSTMPLPLGCHSQAGGSNQNGGYSTSSAHSMHAQQQQQQQYQQQLQQQQLQQQHISSFKSPHIQYANSAVAMSGANAAKLQQQLQQQLLQHQQLQQLQLQQQQLQLQQQQQQPQAPHTTLPNGVRYSNPHFLRRMPHVTKAAESPYGHLGLGAGHHTFSKLLQDPLQGSLVNTAIPEDRDSANYSMSSDQDCNLYATANHLN